MGVSVENLYEKAVKPGVSNTRCAARDAFWEFSNNN